MQTLHGKNLLKEKPVVVGIGELLWDLLPSGKKAGGAPINFVYHATQLGAEGYAISSVGEDLLGNEIIEELNKNNIRYLIERVPYPTGTVSVELDDKGIPVYQITKAVAWDHIKPTANAIDLAEQADVLGRLPNVAKSRGRLSNRYSHLFRIRLISSLTLTCVKTIFPRRL